MDENALETLFELEPEEDPCDHGCPALAEGWQELVSEVERCGVCFEVVAIRLAPVRAKLVRPGFGDERRSTVK